jgi:hypothetical protein
VRRHLRKSFCKVFRTQAFYRKTGSSIDSGGNETLVDFVFRHISDARSASCHQALKGDGLAGARDTLQGI